MPSRKLLSELQVRQDWTIGKLWMSVQLPVAVPVPGKIWSMHTEFGSETMPRTYGIYAVAEDMSSAIRTVYGISTTSRGHHG